MMRKRRVKHKKQAIPFTLIAMLAAAIMLFGAYGLTSVWRTNTPLPTSSIPVNTANNGPLTSNQTYINQVYNATLAGLIPAGGFRTQIVLGNTVPMLVASGAINLSKVEQLYGKNFTRQDLNILTKPSYTNLTLNSSNANFYLLVFWALGISNKNQILSNFSAAAAAQNYSVANFASTGGWTLGTSNNSMTYFNKLHFINLTPQEQNYVYDVSTNTHRPCCNNPTSFPDCNHGAALLALIELGASQGLNESQLYTLALDAQTLWFPSYYSLTALKLHYNHLDYWSNSKLILGGNYSTATGWRNNVYAPLKSGNLLPTSTGGGASCGV